MATITITYAPVDPEHEFDVANVCATFEPNNSYVDLTNEDGEKVLGVYATNVFDDRKVMDTMDVYLNKIVNHPGIIAMINKAIREDAHTFTFEEADPYLVAYYQQLGEGMKEHGITIEVATA